MFKIFSSSYQYFFIALPLSKYNFIYHIRCIRMIINHYIFYNLYIISILFKVKYLYVFCTYTFIYDFYVEF